MFQLPTTCTLQSVDSRLKFKIRKIRGKMVVLARQLADNFNVAQMET